MLIEQEINEIYILDDERRSLKQAIEALDNTAKVSRYPYLSLTVGFEIGLQIPGDLAPAIRGLLAEKLAAVENNLRANQNEKGNKKLSL